MCARTHVNALAHPHTRTHIHTVLQVLIISYETLRLHAARLQQPGACDLLICDE